MTEREKLIKAMKCCAEMNCGHECPYVPIGGCRAKVLQDAIALLEEQEPVVGDRDELLKALREAHKACLNAMQMLAEQEPVVPESHMPDETCPACGTAFIGELSYYLGHDYKKYYAYCPGCGRKVDWNA